MSIERIRQDMPDAMRQLRAVHEWRDADIEDLRAAVGAAVKKREHLDLWADWLGAYAAAALARSAAVRQMEVEMAERARQDNAAADRQRINQSKGQRYDGSGVRNAA